MKTLVILAICSINSYTFAQSYSEETIVVTGTKTKKSSIEAPVKTEVFSKEQIKELHLNSVDEVIPFIPGVTLQENRGREGKSAIIQGMGGSKVMVLIDGVPVIQTTNTGVDLTKLATENIEQIEVIKGAASSLYGSQAMGGVINIITNQQREGLNYTLDMQSGVGIANHDAQTGQTDIPENIAFSLSEKKKLFNYQVDFSRRARETIELDESSIIDDGTQFEKYQANGSLGYRYRKKDNITLRYRYELDKNTSFDSASRGTTGIYDPRETRSDVLNQSWFLLGENNFGEDKLSYNLTYQRVEDEHDQRDDPLTPHTELVRSSLSEFVRGEIQYDMVAFENHVITSGIALSTLSLDQNKREYESLEVFNETKEIEKKYLRSYEAYIQDNIIWEDLELVLGTRGQYDSDFGTQVSPKVSTIYSPNLIEGARTQLRASVGTGYRVPNLKEKFYLLDHSSLGYQLIGNENLEPERSVSFQVGPEILTKKYGNLSVNFFYNQIENLITFKAAESTGPIQQYTYFNTDESESRGLEVDYSYNFFNNSFFNQNFTYAESVNTQTNLFIPGRPLYNLQSTLGLGITSKLTWLNTYTYDGNEYVDEENTEVARGFNTFNTKLNYRAFKNATFEFGINNIFNERRDALADEIITEDNTIRVQDKRPLVGRYFYIGFRIKG